MSNVVLIKNTLTGEESYRGNLRNFGCIVSSNFLSLQGSLPKFYQGENINPLTLAGTKEGIEALSEITGQYLTDAKVTKLDFAYCLSMDHNCHYYFPVLGTMANMYKTAYKYGVRFNNNRKCMSFYDKTKETNKKGGVMPPNFKNSNLLRYEQKYTRDLKGQLKFKNITCKDLTKRSTAELLLRNYKKDFNLISKEAKYDNTIALEIDVSKWKDVEKFLVRKSLAYDGLDSILGYLNQLFIAKEVPHMQRTRIRKQIKSLYAPAPDNPEFGFIQELQDKIEAIQIE